MKAVFSMINICILKIKVYINVYLEPKKEQKLLRSTALTSFS